MFYISFLSRASKEMSFCSCRSYPSQIKVSSSSCSNTTVVVSAVLGVNGTKSLRVNSIKIKRIET